MTTVLSSPWTRFIKSTACGRLNKLNYPGFFHHMLAVVRMVHLLGFLICFEFLHCFMFILGSRIGRCLLFSESVIVFCSPPSVAYYSPKFKPTGQLFRHAQERCAKRCDHSTRPTSTTKATTNSCRYSTESVFYGTREVSIHQCELCSFHV